MTDADRARITRPIVGLEARTAQEVFDIMCDRLRLAFATPPMVAESGEAIQADIDMANDYLGSAFRSTATLAERFARHRLSALRALPASQGAREAGAREVLATILEASDFPNTAKQVRDGLDDPAIPVGEAVEAMLAFATPPMVAESGDT